MEIKILGPGCANCERLEKEARKALVQTGCDATLTHVTDYGEIMEYGVMSTPGLVINNEVVSAGRVLSANDIAKLLPGKE